MTTAYASATLKGRQGSPSAVRAPWSAALLALLAMLVIGGPPAGAQAPSTWIAAVDAYLAGRDNEAAAVLRMPADALKAQAREAQETWGVRARRAPQPEAHIRRLEASALLPLEILLPLSLRVRVADEMSALETIAVDAWLRLEQFENFSFGQSQGRRGEDGIRPPVAAFRQRWRVALLQYLMNSSRYGEFHNRAAEIRVPADDVVDTTQFHLLRGMVSEAMSRMSTTASRHTGERAVASLRLQDLQAALADAEAAYRRALRATPHDREAALHLGRVQFERGRHDDALRTLAPLLDQPCTTTICGLAHLFTGEIHDTRRMTDDASLAYAKASSHPLVRQSALLALTQLKMRRGESQGGLELTTQFTDGGFLGAQDAPDAWSLYVGGRRADSAAVLAPVREAMVP